MDEYSFTGSDSGWQHSGREYTQHHPPQSGGPDGDDGFYSNTNTPDGEDLATRPSRPGRQWSLQASAPGGIHGRDDPVSVSQRRSRRESRNRRDRRPSYSSSGHHSSQHDRHGNQYKHQGAVQHDEPSHDDVYAADESERYTGGLELIPHPRHYRSLPSPPSEGAASDPESYWGQNPVESERYRRMHHGHREHHKMEGSCYTREKIMNGYKPPKRRRGKLDTLIRVVGGLLLAAVLWDKVREERRATEEMSTQNKGRSRRRRREFRGY